MSTARERLLALCDASGLGSLVAYLGPTQVKAAPFLRTAILVALMRPLQGRRQLPASTRCSFPGQVVPRRSAAIIPPERLARGRRLVASLCGVAAALGAGTMGGRR